MAPPPVIDPPSIISCYGESTGVLNLDLSSSNSNSSILLRIYFILATLLTKIIMINTLIAILADTYTRIMDEKEMYALIQRT